MNISINMPRQKLIVDAQPVGEYLAVHESPNGFLADIPVNTGQWTITHVPTGWAIYTRFASQGLALEVAGELCGLDWSFDQIGDFPTRLKRPTTSILKRLLKSKAITCTIEQEKRRAA